MKNLSWLVLAFILLTQIGNAGVSPDPLLERTTSTATLTTVANATGNTTTLLTNALRKGVVVFNDSVTNCYLAFAVTASTTAFTFKLTGGSTYTMDPSPLYTGIITNVCDLASGSLRVTEL